MKLARSGRYILCLVILGAGLPLRAQVSEKERLSGFAEHQKNQKQFDKARQQGERGYLEEEEQWENQKNRNLEAYKKEKKAEIMNEDSPEAKADAAEKRQYEQKQEKERRDYVAEKAHQETLSRETAGLPSEAQELGLEELRPRYDYKKRALYGAQPKYGRSSGSSGFAGSSGSSPSFGGGSSSSFPPPPTFDDFPEGGGYVPAPNMPEDYGDVPPPPPPPPPPFGDDYGGGAFGGSDFPPPPPPPPPPFGDEGADF